MRRLLTCMVLLFVSPLLIAQTTTGTWTLYPPQSQTYQVSVQQPVNPDGTSVWSANKGVVPVQFSLAVGYGPVVFESIQSTGSYSYLTFSPTALTFDQITSLTAVYSFVKGNCHGGSLRWKIAFTDATWVEIYYGDDSTWTDCTTAGSATNQSGLNMIDANFDGIAGGDPRYERSDHSPSFYTTYSNAATFAAGKTVAWIGLILDSGWGGDQVVNLGNVTINDNTFQPQSGSAPTCTLPPANIQVYRIAGGVIGQVDETAIQANADYGSSFRVVDCKYMYNLAAKSYGTGTYKVEVLIDNVPAIGSAIFALK